MQWDGGLHMAPRILVAGAGLMGSSLAKCLSTRGVVVYVYNRTVEKARALCSEAGCRVLENLDSMPGFDATVVFLFDDQAVSGFIEALVDKGLTAEAGVLMVSSTISPETSIRLHGLVTRAGGVYVEAPVYGSTGEASSCSLVSMLAGDQVARSRAEEAASLYSRRMYWVGGVPQAMALKLALNNIGLALPGLLAESLALLEAYGVGSDVFRMVAGDLWFGSMVERYMERAMAAAGRPRFTVSGAAKDYRVIACTLAGKGYPPLVSQGLAGFYTLAASVMPGEDYPRAVNAYRVLKNPRPH
ncbi:NAD(P)-dependent oxidoreductase [Desulfurococcus mucosus]|nr:NAD(P)-binding domain-containing protein [Desulfurococcus mucosus]